MEFYESIDIILGNFCYASINENVLSSKIKLLHKSGNNINKIEKNINEKMKMLYSSGFVYRKQLSIAIHGDSENKYNTPTLSLLLTNKRVLNKRKMI